MRFRLCSALSTSTVSTRPCSPTPKSAGTCATCNFYSKITPSSAPTPTPSLFLAIFAGFTYSRFLLFTGIILCPLLAEEATFLGQDNPNIDKRWLNAGIVTLVLGFAVTHLPATQELTTQSNTGYPAKAVAYLREHPPAGPLFNDFNWGGYILWNDPAQPIFIDTRADIFEQSGLLKNYIDLITLQLPVEDFNHGQLRYVLFPRNAAIIAALNRSPNWTIEYQDDTAVLLRRIR
jgi:hypothetical protein